MKRTPKDPLDDITELLDRATDGDFHEWLIRRSEEDSTETVTYDYYPSNENYEVFMQDRIANALGALALIQANQNEEIWDRWLFWNGFR